MSQFDSLLFDMDGTLWDAVDSYARIWNTTIAEFGLDVAPVTYDALADLMGMPLDAICDRLIGSACADRAGFMDALMRNEAKMMPELGGKLYPGVADTLATLARSHRLFMVSNCGADGLPNFLKYTGLAPLFTDAVSYGQTGVEKDVNIRTLIERYSLKSPLYIGDTAGDCRMSHAAATPFVWAAYGFGANVNDADYKINDISELTDICS